MDSLSALDTGFVYGADEAWERLDTRIQRSEKNRVLYIGMRWAAAAILLILATAGIYIYSTKNAGQQPIAEQQPKKTILPKTQIADTPVNIAVVETLPAPRIHSKRTTVKKITCYAEPEPPQQVIDPPTPGPSPAPPKIESARNDAMALVHINDLGKPQPQAEPLVWSGPSLDISKMKIVTLTDIDKQNTLLLPATDEAIVYRATKNSGSLLRGYYGEGNMPVNNLPLSIRFGKRN